MKSFLIFASIVALSSASIGEVSNEIEEEAIRLWQKFCEGKPASDEPSNEDNTYIYCKPSQSTTEVPVFHDTTFPTEENPDKVVVFIRPPAIEYNHNVTVKGLGPALPKTIIYVKNVQHNHTISVETKTSKPPTDRPVVYYLKKGHTNGIVDNKAPAPVTTAAPATTTSTTPDPSITLATVATTNPPFISSPYFNQATGQEFDPPLSEPSLNHPNFRPPQYFHNGYNYPRRYN